jgi:hypothetical protein
MRNILHQVLDFAYNIDEIKTENTAMLYLTFSQGEWLVQNLQGITLPSRKSEDIPVH